MGVPSSPDIDFGVDAQARTDDLYRLAFVVGRKSYTGCFFTANCDSREMLSGIGLAPALDLGKDKGAGFSLFFRYEFSVIGRLCYELGTWEMPSRSQAYGSLGWEIFTVGSSYELREKQASVFAALSTPLVMY